VLIIEDLTQVTHRDRLVRVTSTQVELAFTAALESDGLLAAVDARHDDVPVDTGVDDEQRAVLLAVSTNGPQMTSGSTPGIHGRCARLPSTSVARHPQRPGLDREPQRPIKIDYPHLLAIRDPATLHGELDVVRQHYNVL
jgi:putative transposase